MSTSNSLDTSPSSHESDILGSDAPESKTKRTANSIQAHVVSWTWLFGGLTCFFVLVGTFGLVYYMQTRNQASKMIAVADDMLKRSDENKAAMQETDDMAQKREFGTASLKERSDAASLLDRYLRTAATPSAEVSRKLYEILESLYDDYGGATTSLGRRHGDRLIRLAADLAPTASPADSIEYRKRLLELEWDRQHFLGVLTRGRELFAAAQSTNDPSIYDAQRFIAMTLFDHLPSEVYNPANHSLPTEFDDAMDDLLRKLNDMRPEDIEIARRYAEFTVGIDHSDPERRRIINACASDTLRGKQPEERLADAKKIIDDMVNLNNREPDAYLARYHFESHFAPRSDMLGLGAENPNLAMVLKLDPDRAEGLILSSLDALRQAEILTRNAEPEQAVLWQNKAEGFLRRTVSANSTDAIGYQYLGDFLLFVKNEPREAIEVWDAGLNNADNRGDEELIGRLVLVLLNQKMVDEVREKMGQLNRTINEMQITRPWDVRRTGEMRDLLLGQLANTEAAIAATQEQAARRENNAAEATRLASIAQLKKGEAIQLFERVLGNWGRTREDYLFLREKKSVYNMLLPESLLQLGDLRMESGEWDRAISCYRRVLPIETPAVQRMARLKLSSAYQQDGQLGEAAAHLKQVCDLNPEDLALRYAYATLLFRSQIASNSPDPVALGAIEQELDYLGEHRDKLGQPWALDIRKIHLAVLRANLTNSTEIILEAMRDAARQFRALERQKFPPDAEGNERNYIDDPAFVTEMVGIYSSLAERADFDRLLEVLRAFPGIGEDAYYEARINDALRRGDREGAIIIIDEASANTLLSDARKERLVALLQTLRGDTADRDAALDRLYNQLKTTFDEAPETLNPQAFFVLANMSLDTDEHELTQRIMERMKQIEGPNGTNWRYIQVRLMLAERDPDFVTMRRIQDEIVAARPAWDMSYLLKAMIEERFLIDSPADTETRTNLIEAYRGATANGNTRPEVWQRLVELLESAERIDDAREYIRMAAMRGVRLDARSGQFPQPYARMYSQVQEEIVKEDPTEADRIARQCIQLAEVRGVKPELIFSLNLALGKVFLDTEMYDSAIRHLTETAKSGGTYIYPLALALAKSGKVDEGFTRLLDEIERVPSAMPSLLPAILVLNAQVKPSEAVYQRIDSMMNRVERGERLTLRTTLPEGEEYDHEIPLATNRVSSRRIQSFVIRFPENTGNIDPASIVFFAPEDMEEEDVPEEEK